MTAAEVRFAIDRLDPPRADQARHALASAPVAASGKNDRNLPRPVNRRLQILLVDQTHPLKIARARRRRLAIHGRARQPQQRALPRDRQIQPAGFDLLDALRPVYFLSTSDKKSRSTINWPIVSGSFAILPSSVLACRPVSKVLAASRQSAFFQA